MNVLAPFSLLVFAIAVASGLLAIRPTPNAEAHGIIDQAWEGAFLPNERSEYQIQANQPIGMEFTPSRNTLVGVDISIVTLNAGLPDATITVQMREGTITGAILTTVAQTVSAGVHGFVHFDFPSVVAIEPGRTYVIEAMSSNGVHGWYGNEAKGQDGEYPGGDPIVTGQPGGTDFLFRTYSEGVPPALTASPTLTPARTPTTTPTGRLMSTSTAPPRTLTPVAVRLPSTGNRPPDATDALPFIAMTIAAAGALAIAGTTALVTRRKREVQA